jgi:hypothetical protein
MFYVGVLPRRLRSGEHFSNSELTSHLEVQFQNELNVATVSWAEERSGTGAMASYERSGLGPCSSPGSRISCQILKLFLLFRQCKYE